MSNAFNFESENFMATERCITFSVICKSPLRTAVLRFEDWKMRLWNILNKFCLRTSVAVRKRRLFGVDLLGERDLLRRPPSRQPAPLAGQLRVVRVSGNRPVRLHRWSPEPRRQHQITQDEAGHHCHKGALATCTLLYSRVIFKRQLFTISCAGILPL